MTVRWVPISAIAALKRDALEVDVGETYRTLGLLNRGRGVFVRPPVLGGDTKYPRFYRVRPGQLVYSKLFAWEGSVAVVPEGMDGYCVSPEFPTFDIAADVLPAFLGHVVQWSGFADRLAVSTTGLGQRRQRVNLRDFEAIEVPIPSLDVQRRIAAHLDNVARTAEGLVDRAQGTGVATDALVNTAVASASKGPHRSAGELLIIDREWFEPDTVSTYWPIGVRGFGRGLIRYSGQSREALSKLRYYPVRPNRLMISNIKAWEGAVTVTTTRDAHRIASNRFLQYRVVDDAVLLGWVHLYLLSRAGIAQLQRASPGSADRNRTLSIDNFQAIRIPLPPLDVQRRVLLLAERRDAVVSALARRAAFTDALLPAARNEVFSAMR